VIVILLTHWSDQYYTVCTGQAYRKVFII